MNTITANPPLSFTARIRSSLFDVVANEPEHAPRYVLKIVATLFAVLVIWCIFAKLDIVAVAEGRLVPQTYVKIVQPAESGVIREILVDEGDVVTQGQVLVRMDPTVNAADGTAIDRELNQRRLQMRRIESELAGRPLKKEAADDALLFAQVESQRVSHRQTYLDTLAQETAAYQRANNELSAAREVLKKLITTLPSYQRSADAFEKLEKEKLVSSLQADEKRRDATEKSQDLETQRSTVSALEARLSEQQQKMAHLKSSYETGLHQERLQAITEITRLEQQSHKVNYQQGLLELKAPQAGIVKDLATTTIGAVVQPGTVLLSLVPQNEPLLAEVMIENKDIGFVKPGQSVRIKLATYQFQKYGMLEGIVKTVSADSQSNAKPKVNDPEENAANQSALAFKAIIQLNEQELKVKGLVLALAAGMQVSAEIIEGKRTVLEYLLSPVQQVTGEAGRER